MRVNHGPPRLGDAMPGDRPPGGLDPGEPGRMCSVLVMSCDAYDDLWPPFFTLLRRHWPDIPFPVYLGVESKTAPIGSVTTLHSPRDGRDWTGRLKDYLDQLETPYVLLLLEDFFFRRPVRTAEVLGALRFAMDHAACQVRLVPRPPPTRRLPAESTIGVSAPGSRYRLSTQGAIWDRAALAGQLVGGETIWQFEHRGNERIANVPAGYYSVWRPILTYEGWLAHHVVEKGRWFPHEKWRFGRAGVGCDFSRRGTLDWTATAFYHGAHLLHGCLSFLPEPGRSRATRRLKRFFARLFPGRVQFMSGSSPGKGQATAETRRSD